MVTSLQQRLALAVLVGVLLIPSLAGNLRGLTHLLTCEEGVAEAFAIAGLDGGDPLLTSSTELSNPALDDEPTPDAGAQLATTSPDGLLCGALRVQLSAEAVADDLVLLTVDVTNDSDLPWSGTLDLAADGDAVTVGSGLSATVGRVEPGESATTALELRVPPGQTDLAGTLLLGP